MKIFAVAALATMSMTSVTSFAQKKSNLSSHKLDFEAVGAPLKTGPLDPEIVAALKAVSSERIKANITRLVEFHNRSTISSTEADLKPGTGVFAAADWIKSQ